MSHQLRLIGEDLYFHGYKVTVLVAELPPTVRADFEDLLYPRRDHVKKPQKPEVPQ